MTHKTSEQFAASDLKQQTLAMIHRHLEQIRTADKPMTSTEGNILSNYLKALLMAEKMEVDQLAANDPRQMSDEDLRSAAKDALAVLGEDHAALDPSDEPEISGE